PYDRRPPESIGAGFRFTQGDGYSHMSMIYRKNLTNSMIFFLEYGTVVKMNAQLFYPYLSV
ncbi:hypothetical protein, partial [Cecembia sp.]|uniref:hypothetical protein n=1 Tax=Cecembia sp. TaxID=1898110 RepID=UPI0025BACEF1